MMASWSKQAILGFIELYRRTECLWKVNSKDYSNRLLREQGYRKLVKFCLRFDPHANKDLVAKKINNIRNTFRKELRKVEASKASGAGPEEVYKPKLWYYDILYFLCDQELPRVGSAGVRLGLAQDIDESTTASYPDSHDVFEMSVSPKVESDLSVDSETEITEEQYTEPGPSSTSKQILRPTPRTAQEAKRPKKRKYDDDDYYDDNDYDDDYDDGIDDERIKAPRMHPQNSNPPSREDQHDVFGKYVAVKLRVLPKEQRIHAEKLIADVFYEAELGSLSRGCTILRPYITANGPTTSEAVESNVQSHMY